MKKIRIKGSKECEKNINQVAHEIIEAWFILQSRNNFTKYKIYYNIGIVELARDKQIKNIPLPETENRLFELDFDFHLGCDKNQNYNSLRAKLWGTSFLNADNSFEITIEE